MNPQTRIFEIGRLLLLGLTFAVGSKPTGGDLCKFQVSDFDLERSSWKFPNTIFQEVVLMVESGEQIPKGEQPTASHWTLFGLGTNEKTERGDNMCPANLLYVFCTSFSSVYFNIGPFSFDGWTLSLNNTNIV